MTVNEQALFVVSFSENDERFQVISLYLRAKTNTANERFVRLVFRVIWGNKIQVKIHVNHGINHNWSTLK